MWPFRAKPKSDGLDKKRLEAFGPLAIVSALCIGPKRLPVMHGIREQPHNISDSGWMLSSGQESGEFRSEVDNYKIVPLGRMIDTDQTLAPMRDWPIGTEVTRRNQGEPWRFIVDDKVVDDDGKVVGELESGE